MKKLAVLLSLVVMLTSNSISVFAKSYDIGEVFPNLPSLLNPGYAENMNELTDEQKRSVLDHNYYFVEGEEEPHAIRKFTGTMSGTYCSTDILMRADIELKNTDSKLAEMLSDDGIINVRLIHCKTNPGGLTYLLCLYGNKAEQWFKQDYGMFLPKSVFEVTPNRPTSDIYSTEELGCQQFFPIVCVSESYRDITWLNDYINIEVFVEYEDEDWLLPKSLNFKWLYGFDVTVDIDDIKATSNFKEYFVDLNPKLPDKEAQAAREAKYEEYYYNIPEYDPFSDENYGKTPEEIEQEEAKKKNKSEKKEIILDEEPEEKTEKIPTNKVIIPYDSSMSNVELDLLFRPQPIPVPDEYDENGTTYYDSDDKSENKSTWKYHGTVSIPYDPSMTQEELDSLFQPQPMPVPDEYDENGTKYYNSKSNSNSGNNTSKKGQSTANTDKIQATNHVTVPKPAPVSLYIDGKLKNPEQAPIVDNNRTLVPMRIIFEALGAEVIWKAEDKTITARKEDKIVVLQIGNSVMKNGESEIPLDTAPVLQNSFTMIPIRAVAEAFDADVIWNEFDKAVVIETR